jgi:hypothetical protein
MLLPCNDAEWREVAKGDRLVCQRTHDQRSRYYAIVTSRGLASVARGKILADQHAEEGMGKVRPLPQSQVLGFIGHPMVEQLWVDDFIWINDLNNDGSSRNDGRRFAVVTSVCKQAIAEIRRFNQHTKSWSKSPTTLQSDRWMRLGNANNTADQIMFQKLVAGEMPLPKFVERLQMPAPPPFIPPEDPRAYSWEVMATVASLRDGKSRTLSRFEYSTKYAQGFLYHLKKIRSGEEHALGCQAKLTYYGPPHPDIPGSEIGEVVICFDEGKPVDDDAHGLTAIEGPETVLPTLCSRIMTWARKRVSALYRGRFGGEHKS